MSYCQNCHKGKDFGHMVSHAKNRLRRTFKPNIQKLRVLQNGISISVKLCTSCIKRLKKDKKFGIFSLPSLSLAPKKAVVAVESLKPVKKKVEKKKETLTKVAKDSLDISSIVGKKS